MNLSYQRWKQVSRYRDVTRICLPLVVGMSATTIMEFTDRIFLANYSIEAISAVVPAGITSFLFMVFFGGIGSYISVFIAQYTGSGKNHMVGRTLWQGIYFTLIAGVVLVALSFFAARPLFLLAGHSEPIRLLEETYFNILCRGAVLHVAVFTFSAFFNGLGRTRPVMLANIAGMLINIPLDYTLIYGAFGLPEMGVAGAAIATVTSWGVTCLLLVCLIYTGDNIKRYQLTVKRGVDRDIFARLLRYGIPGSLQFCLDILAFTFFILMVGRIGDVELAATNIVLSISSLSFMPSIAVGQGVSTLTGQALGAGSPDLARRATWSAVHLTFVYILVIDLLFIFCPETIMQIFIPGHGDAISYQAVASLGSDLLHIIAAYLFFDSFYMVFSGTLKGAGDTRFVMIGIALASISCIGLPLYLGIEYFQMTVVQAWLCVLVFIFALFLLVALRYRQGKWQQMLVIKRESTGHPDTP